MTVIRAALDEMFAVIGQMVGSVFRHGLPLTDKIAARTALTNFFLHIHPVRVRRSWIRMSYTLCLGGLSFFLFIVLTVTGLFLMFYYVPSTSHAYQDMRDLQFVVTFGGVIRNMHRWAAHAMVITVWLHMARVFLTAAGGAAASRARRNAFSFAMLSSTAFAATSRSVLPVLASFAARAALLKRASARLRSSVVI